MYIRSLPTPLHGAVHCSRSEGWGTAFEDLTATHLFHDLNTQLGGAILFSQRT